MLARTVLTAAELGVPEKFHTWLLGFLGRLERGEVPDLRGAPDDLFEWDTDWKGAPAGLDMSIVLRGTTCGTACCVVGYYISETLSCSPQLWKICWVGARLELLEQLPDRVKSRLLGFGLPEEESGATLMATRRSPEQLAEALRHWFTTGEC